MNEKMTHEGLKLSECIKILRNLKPKLKERFKVSKIGIFGSYTKNLQKKDSDIDILVKFSEPIGLDFFDLLEYIEKNLGIKVDLVSIDAISPYIKPYIEKNVVFIE
ncbi:MAG: nucleotidyltransferase family protein [Candidatus Helarchaeota archaeon]